MSSNLTSDEAAAPARPPVVDYAVYALIVRCVCSLGAALALFGAKGEVTRTLSDANKSKNWSVETLQHNVDSTLRANLITTLVMIVLVGIVIKFVREGRNWARWLYLAFAILITRDIFQVLGFFQYHNLLVRLLTGLVGLSALAALAMLFLPAANGFFRPSGAAGGFLGSMFGPRLNTRLPAATTPPATPEAEPVPWDNQPPAGQPAPRRAPRAKSRQVKPTEH